MEEQLIKARSPMVLTESGRASPVSLVQSANALLPILTIPSGMTMVTSSA